MKTGAHTQPAFRQPAVGLIVRNLPPNSKKVETVCPVCGHVVMGESLVLDHANRTIARGNITVRLPRKLFRLFVALWRARHTELLSADDLATFLWPDDHEPKNPRKCVHVHIAFLRQRCVPLGILIMAHRGVGGGYRMLDD